MARKVGLIIAANPSTMVNLARAGDLEKETLLRDLADGTLSDRFDIPQDVRAALKSRIRKRYPEKVREFEEIIRRTGTLYPKDFWPSGWRHRQLDGGQRRRLPASFSQVLPAARRCATSA